MKPIRLPLQYQSWAHNRTLVETAEITLTVQKRTRLLDRLGLKAAAFLLLPKP
jgi:hypothetical protein